MRDSSPRFRGAGEETPGRVLQPRPLCLHPQPSAIVRRKPDLQDGYRNGWVPTLLSHLAALYGKFGVDRRKFPPAESHANHRFLSGGARIVEKLSPIVNRLANDSEEATIF